ncbi:hypothetical protein BSKO_13981 [Bryopsis sp. KO-2023]|nr:hypothetical protein BSKO_13981 [Bryopsis sp. KO-2023]
MEEKVTVELRVEDGGVRARVGVAGLPPGLLGTKAESRKAPRRRAKKGASDVHSVAMRMGYVQVILLGRGTDEVELDLFVVPRVLADPMGLSVGWMGRPVDGPVGLLPSIPVDDYFRPFKGAMVNAKDAPVGLPKPPWQVRSEFLEKTRREELEAEKLARQELARNAMPFGEWRARRVQERREGVKESQGRGKGSQSPYGGVHRGHPRSLAFPAQEGLSRQSSQPHPQRHQHQHHHPGKGRFYGQDRGSNQSRSLNAQGPGPSWGMEHRSHHGQTHQPMQGGSFAEESSQGGAGPVPGPRFPLRGHYPQQNSHQHPHQDRHPYSYQENYQYSQQDSRDAQVVSPPDLHRPEMSSDSFKFTPSWAVSDPEFSSPSRSTWSPHKPWIGDKKLGGVHETGWGGGGSGNAVRADVGWERNRYRETEKVNDSSCEQPVRKGRASSICGQTPDDFPVGRSTANALEQDSLWAEPGIRHPLDASNRSRRNSVSWDDHRVNGGRILEEPQGDSKWFNDGMVAERYLTAPSDRSLGSRSTGNRSAHSQHMRSGSHMSGGSYSGNKMNVEVVEAFERWSADSSRDGLREDLESTIMHKSGGSGKVVPKASSKSPFLTTWESSNDSEARAAAVREQWFHGEADGRSPNEIVREMDSSHYPFKRSVVKSSFAPKKMGPDKKGKASYAQPSERSPYLTTWEDVKSGDGVDRRGVNKMQKYSARELMESDSSIIEVRLGKKDQPVAAPVEGSPYLTTWDGPSGSGSPCELDSGAWDGPADIVERGGSALDRPIQVESQGVKMQSGHSSLGRPLDGRMHLPSDRDSFMGREGGRHGGSQRGMSHPRSYGSGRGRGRAYGSRPNRDFNREDARNHGPQWNHGGKTGVRGKYPQGSRFREGPSDFRSSRWNEEESSRMAPPKQRNAPHAHLEQGSGTDRPVRLGPGSHEFKQRNLGPSSGVIHHTSDARPSSSGHHQGFESKRDEPRVQYSRLSEKAESSTEGGGKVCGMLRSDPDSKDKGGPANLFKRVLAGALKDCIQAKDAKLSAQIHGEGSVQVQRRIQGPRQTPATNNDVQRTRGLRPRCLSDVNAIPVPPRRGGAEN